MKDTWYKINQQDAGYYTIFDGNGEQYCDEDGNPIRFENYKDAEIECDTLNDEFSDEFGKLQCELAKY